MMICLFDRSAQSGLMIQDMKETFHVLVALVVSWLKLQSPKEGGKIRFFLINLTVRRFKFLSFLLGEVYVRVPHFESDFFNFPPFQFNHYLNH